MGFRVQGTLLFGGSILGVHYCLKPPPPPHVRLVLGLRDLVIRVGLYRTALPMPNMGLHVQQRNRRVVGALAVRDLGTCQRAAPVKCVSLSGVREALFFHLGWVGNARKSSANPKTSKCSPSTWLWRWKLLARLLLRYLQKVPTSFRKSLVTHLLMVTLNPKP